MFNVLEGLKGTLPPAALKPPAKEDGSPGECNIPVAGLTEYKTGTKVLVIRATNPDNVKGRTAGVENMGSLLTPTTTNHECAITGS